MLSAAAAFVDHDGWDIGESRVRRHTILRHNQHTKMLDTPHTFADTHANESKLGARDNVGEGIKKTAHRHFRRVVGGQSAVDFV